MKEEVQGSQPAGSSRNTERKGRETRICWTFACLNCIELYIEEVPSSLDLVFNINIENLQAVANNWRRLYSPTLDE